ncbi:MAG: Fic family protein, partial [Chloroflexi bacterium]|nr:Fic family protein [Chloroflexota bacterium]
NYIRAFERARLEELPLSLRLVRELHSLLLDGVADIRSTPGEFRRSQNWLGPAGCTPANAVFVPPPVAEMRELLHNWEGYLHESSELPPLVRVALAHYQLAVIHPFLSMNAAAGLLFAPLYLHHLEKADFPMLFIGRFLERQSIEFYHRMLDVCQRGSWDEWLSFYLYGIADSANDTATCVHHLLRLYARNVNHAESQATDDDALRALKMLFQHPVVSTDGTADFLGLTAGAARRALARLEDAGVVTQDTSPACPVYVAGDIVAALGPDSSPSGVYAAFF